MTHEVNRKKHIEEKVYNELIFIEYYIILLQNLPAQKSSFLATSFDIISAKIEQVVQ